MKYLKLFTDFVDCLEGLEDAERGRLFTAMLLYARDGRLPMLPGNERFLWASARQQIDRMEAQYQKIRAVNSSNARKRCNKPAASGETSYDLDEIKQLIEQNSGG